MLAPRSYTREDVVELQCHGNDLCLRRVLRACLEAGARLADPGQLLLTLSLWNCHCALYQECWLIGHREIILSIMDS
jgi:hypothetical protein